MSDYSSEDFDKNPLRCGSATRAFEMHIWQGDWGFYTQFKLCHPRWQNMSKVRLADGMQSHLSAVCDIESCELKSPSKCDNANKADSHRGHLNDLGERLEDQLAN